MADYIKSLPGEIWKPVPGYEGRYLVSNKGRVRALPRYIRTAQRRLETGRDYTPDRLLKLNRGHMGHAGVNLNWAARGMVNERVGAHRLVYMAFVGPVPEGYDVCHNDGDPTNNDPANLRADTRSGNELDKHRHGTKPRKLTDDDVRDIRRRVAAGERQVDIAARFCVSRQTVSGVAMRKFYAWL